MENYADPRLVRVQVQRFEDLLATFLFRHSVTRRWRKRFLGVLLARGPSRA